MGLPREVHLRPRPRFHVRSATGLSADSLRRYLRLRTGRSVDVRSLADVSLTSESAPRLDFNLDGNGDVVLRVEQGAQWLAPMWPPPGAAEVSSEDVELQLPLPEEGAWLWDGGDWTRWIPATEAFDEL